jgi:hypothetical protein
LDARDGNQEKKRQKAYDSLCEYAAHATYDGFLLTIKEGSPQLGPFFDERILLAWLSEMALRFVPAAAQFGALFSNLDRTLLDMQHKFANHVLAWQARNSGSAAAKQSPAAPN